MISLNEDDLQVVRWLQELHSCTPARAKEIYRQHAAKLADPTRLDRHDIISDNIGRSLKDAESGKSSATPKETKAMATKEAKKSTKKKAKKAAAEAPRAVVELAPLTREVELTPVGSGVYTANLFGNKKHAVALSMYDNAKESSPLALGPFSEARIKAAKKFAKENEMEVAYCATLLVKGKPVSGFALPEDLFKKFANEQSRGRVRMGTSAEARAAYREGGWDDCKFSVAKAEEAAAA